MEINYKITNKKCKGDKKFYFKTDGQRAGIAVEETYTGEKPLEFVKKETKI